MKDPPQPQQQHQHRRRGTWRWRTWILRVGTSVLLWTALMQLTSVVEVWHSPLPRSWPSSSCFDHLRQSSRNDTDLSVREVRRPRPVPTVPAPRPRRVYNNNGYLLISCNGGLNQMRAAICDMVTVTRFLNLTLVVPELDKTSFWNDSSEFGDIFDIKHFISSLRHEVRIIKELPKKLKQKVPYTMPPVSWSNEKYYSKQILPLFPKHKVIHFNRTDARLANNGLRPSLQRLRCRVNYKALKFTPQIEALGEKLISKLRKRGPFVVLHLRYEMDMLAFSGCTHGCSKIEVKELTRMRYAYPWWKEKEIVSEEKRLDGMCPLTPEEATLVLQAMSVGRETQIYLASGEIYGGERRLAALRTAYPNLVKKETLLHHDEIKAYQNHSSQMAALDYLMSIASDVFIPSYDGNMAKVVEGHRRYLGFRKSILLNRKELVRLIDMFQSKMLSWEQFSAAVRDVHLDRMGQPTKRRVIPDKPKEEDYFYANPEECLGPLIISHPDTGSGHSDLWIS